MTRKKFSHYHSLATFLGKCIPKQGSGEHSNLFIHEVIAGLKRLEAIQRDNPLVTLPFDVDGINVLHSGTRIFRIMPAQKHLLVIFADQHTTKTLDDAIANGLSEDSSQSTYRSWKVPAQGLELLWDLVAKLPPPPDGYDPTSDHPRYFSVASRLAAIDAFERDGSLCPGFGERKKHKVDLDRGDRIEFDHILPFAKGGSSSERNVRVMCQECNRLKGTHFG